MQKAIGCLVSGRYITRCTAVPCKNDDESNSSSLSSSVSSTVKTAEGGDTPKERKRRISGSRDAGKGRSRSASAAAKRKSDNKVSDKMNIADETALKRLMERDNVVDEGENNQTDPKEYVFYSLYYQCPFY